MSIHSLPSPPLPDPLEQLSRAERRRWRRDEQRTRQAHEAEQLRLLRNLAAVHAEVGSLSAVERPDGFARSARQSALGGAIELVVGARRLACWLPAVARASLEAALAQGPVQIASVGRYGPFWTFAFAGRGAPRVVLADRVALLPDAGGMAYGQRSPQRQLAR